MARRRIRVADSKEVLVAWDRGQSVSAIARMLGYTRPTVRKYIGVAQRLEIRPGAQSRDDLEWDALARTVQERLARHRARTPKWTSSLGDAGAIPSPGTGTGSRRFS